jgi:hypothetical protein
MSETPRILLVDDGELSEVAMMLERLHVDHVRLRGGQVEDDLPPPSHLLIATARRASAVRRGSPPGLPEGRPLRIIAVDEDSTAMRRMLRRMGFHLLVRRGVHPEVWRLLTERALFQGPERRREKRQPIVAPISLSAYRESREDGSFAPAQAAHALLVDISNRGCRLSTDELLEPGSRIALSIRLDDLGGEVLQLRGRLVRSSTDASSSAHGYTAAMLFDSDLAEGDRMLLSQLLNDLSVGPGSITYGPAEALPPCESPTIPGLTLDAETDPAIHAGVKIEIDKRAAADSSPAEVIDLSRRRSPRGSFTNSIVAEADEHNASQSRVLMGRDLSAQGMRVERASGIAVGDRFTLALYGPAQQQPFLIDARVARDDGNDGFGLTFVDLPTEIVRELEKLVACLPDIESLEAGEAGGLGSVISEIVAKTRD